MTNDQWKISLNWTSGLLFTSSDLESSKIQKIGFNLKKFLLIRGKILVFKY